MQLCVCVCLAKDPFYMQLTRDAYRRMFGSPDDKRCYARVIICSKSI